MTTVEATTTPSLASLRVVEVGQLIAGPFCGHLFADHGAEVIKVERPGAGDPMREWGGRYRGIGLYWPIISRQKKSVTLDLRCAEGQDAFGQLLATADVLVENFRPGRMEAWGFGDAEVEAINPRLVYVRVSGFGQSGPYRQRAGFGSIGEAIGGIRHVTGDPDRPPSRCGISLGDALAATQAFVGALLALYSRDANGARSRPLGRGQVVDVALYEAVWMYMESAVAEYQKLGTVRERTGSELPGVAPSNAYPTSTGEWVVIGANHDAVFVRLAEAIGRSDWVADGSALLTHAGRWEQHEALDASIGAWTAERPVVEVLDILNAAAVPASKIYSAKDIAGDPHYAARDMVLQVPEPSLGGEEVAMPGIIPKLSVTPGAVGRGGPILGEHNDEVWAEILGAERLEALRAAGVV